ncbi:PREDICTED: tetratricopeptide repeat protein 7B isoform X1 [Polistes dominula]|uniref:Tetratricopeptide repeat protein 7B isoform X1 n=1 Tax=Polistes dominula TaxID=743375 RepID=A0ABM1IIX0_POLDO|nr:PREDICTED: tetratricopeptide repeat protein 7B isoform X1 [Polistes dominula]XP_015180158.1 PREDICTED: tetratricopeptide repeat protein 7B isoform X1 [Polistes dominula]XP_015180159.1 PREDICTED: tetratricopeptide repeat protein 7B isoform X1 [Polistes dominula]XP_015180160.1 PREDICTED: tetratricopeptide repeat protein 7B isoform X1 [Polistes dominula]
MTSKKSHTLRIESEIDRNREEANWKKVIELAEHLKAQYPNNECLANFLCGEGRLENFLEQTPPIDSNITKAKSGLLEAKRYLLLAANEKDKQALVVLDAHLLLGKLHYAMGMYEEALYHYQQAELHTLTEKELPSRSLRIIAESYAIKGLSLERLPPNSKTKFRIAEWQEEMVKCFIIAGDLTLVYLQELDKIALQQQNGSVTVNSNNIGVYTTQSSVCVTKQIGPILETALQRSPLLYLQTGNVQAAIARYREVLSAVETTATQNLRVKMTKQLAEVLLRKICSTDYKLPEGLIESTDSPWKPKRYVGLNMFLPKNEYEELILLLLISEAMAVRDAVLSQSPEFKEARIQAFENATNIYDLLTIIVVRWNQVDLLHESFERAMKFSHEEAHTWTQYALCLISLGKYMHAYTVLKVVTRLSPHKVVPCLLAARLCYEQFNRILEGIDWSHKALQRETASPQGMQSRCHLYIGIGHSILSANTTIKQDKLQYTDTAMDCFQKAQQCDPNDHLAEYYLAHEYAMNRQINEAMIHVKIALSLRAEHIPSLHLLVLLLSANKQYSEALHLINSVLEEYPDNLNFLYVKAHLELRSISGEVALFTIKQMFSLWKSLFEDQTNITCNEQHSEKRSEIRSVCQFFASELSDKDSSSMHAQSLAASRVEQALSEVASSLSSFTPKPGPQRAWVLQLQVWLLLAEVFLAMDQPNGAILSLQEASSIFPLSHHIMYTRGLLHEYKLEYSEAKQCYQNAVTINPSHVKSLQHLGLIHHYLGNQRLAEKTLRDAAKIDPNSHQTWYNLGKVLESLGEVEGASDCMATALEVETTNPILPILSIPLTFE